MKQLTLLLLILIFSAPAYAGIVVVNGLSHQHTQQSGEQVSGQIVIRNTGATLENVKIYLRDYSFNQQGNSFFPEGGSSDRSNANWVELKATYLSLQPKEEHILNYRITAPQQDSLNGTYWSVVMIEGVGAPDSAKLAKGVQINTQVRYAVQLISHIGQTGSRELQFLDYQLTQKEGQQYLQITLDNPGQRMLQPLIKLEAYDTSGNLAGTFSSRKRKLYPGTSLRFELALAALTPREYQGLVIADCEDDGIFGANLEFKIESSDQ